MVWKWLTMLKDVVPNLSRANLMFNPAVAPDDDVYLRSFEAIPRSIKAEVAAAPVRDTAEVEATIAKLARDPGNGLIAAADPFIIELVLNLNTAKKPALMPRQKSARNQLAYRSRRRRGAQ